MTKIETLASRNPQAAANAHTHRADRPISVRLDQKRLNYLRALAELDRTSPAQQIRLAAEAYVEARLADPQLALKANRAVARLGKNLEPLIPGLMSEYADDELATPPPPERDLETETTVTLRLAQPKVDYLTSLALLDDYTLADELRAAADRYIAARLEDSTLEEAIKRSREDREDLLELLSAAG